MVYAIGQALTIETGDGNTDLLESGHLAQWHRPRSECFYCSGGAFIEIAITYQ